MMSVPYDDRTQKTGAKESSGAQGALSSRPSKRGGKGQNKVSDETKITMSLILEYFQRRFAMHAGEKTSSLPFIQKKCC
jgi:hypothetical protein